MINLWDYKDTKNVILTTTDGKQYKGFVSMIIDSSEFEGIEDNPEDCIDLDLDNGEFFTFKVSEIANITAINRCGATGTDGIY